MKKVILVILDGVGIRKEVHGNAVALAKKPNLDYLMSKFPHTTLLASGAAVGLPEGQMGNSEVGHLNIGAGRIIYTGLSLINKQLEEGTFYKNVAFLKAIQHAKKNHGKLHIMGLTSNGGVHSNLDHILALVKLAHTEKVKCVLHCFGDGRDVDPKSLINDMKTIEAVAKANGAKIGMISGRYYAMDRDKRWERSNWAYQTLLGKGRNTFTNPIEYIQTMYDRKITDEFIEPALNNSCAQSEVIIKDNDAIIFANFRPDRARQLSHLIFGSKYYDFTPETRRKNLFFVTMMNYEGIEPSMVAYPPQRIEDTLGKVLADNNLRQLRIAETEKYAHVTFFFDGGVEVEYPGETKIIVPSPKVPIYDLQPEMSAPIVCDKLIEAMPNNNVIICNFANGDMVGHTGNLDATIKSIETLDAMIGKIYKEALKMDFTLFITADHGNADEELDESNNKVTSHTLSPVPFLVTDDTINLLPNGKLANIAPTILQYLGIKKPIAMNENSLIDSKNPVL